MALVLGLREEALVGLCESRDLDTTNPLIAKLIAIPERTEKSLKALSVQAAKVAGPAMAHAPKVCAVAFLAILGLSTWGTYRKIDALAKKVEEQRERAERKAPETLAEDMRQ